MVQSATFQKDGTAYRVLPATPQDFQRLVAFYDDVIEETAKQESSPRWEKGVHPSEQRLLDALCQGTLWTCWTVPEGADANAPGHHPDALLEAAMIMDDECSPGYERAPWCVSAQPDQIAVVHLFAVHPTSKGQGLGRRMLDFAKDMARAQGKRVIRLDVIFGNEVVCKVYERAGFQLVCTQELDYTAVPDNRFYLYEYEL